MKKIFCLLLVVLSFAGTQAAKKSFTNNKNAVVVETAQHKLLPDQLRLLSSLSVKDIEELTARKFSLKEKLSWLLLKKQLKKQYNQAKEPDKKINNKAVLGFVFSLLSLFIFPLFAIPAFILSNDALIAERESPGTLSYSNKTLARVGKIISILVAILLVVVIVLLLAFIAAIV